MMKNKLKFYAFVLNFSVLGITSCTEKTPPPTLVVNNFICNIKLDSSVLEMYKIDTQTINITTKVPVTKIASIDINTKHELYTTYTFNNNATTITKSKAGRISPARSFKIVNDFFYYGDDISIIKNCSDSSLVLFGDNEQVSATEMNVYWAYLRKK
ncbi:MAG: hypothetical protein ACOYMA_12850 [Bacteroidia bacterium]